MFPLDDESPDGLAPPAAPQPGTADAGAPTAVAAETAEWSEADLDQIFPSHYLDRDAVTQLLVTPGEVIQLLLGKRRSLRPKEFVPRSTAVAAQGECPRWHHFLARVTGGNAELQAYLQRMAGYLLTASTAENVLFFLYGPGANGKTVFANTIARIMGRYAATVPMATLLAGARGHGAADLKSLARARLLTARETEEGERWAEARLKALTGGDPVAAKRGRDVLEFTPEFKLLVLGNYKPQLKNIDLAIRRRIQVIPFSQVIPPEERDRFLAERLWSEASGILQWMVEGAHTWYREGLSPPPAVREATADYLDGEDLVGQWIAQCCATSDNAAATTADLFQSWCQWAQSAGHAAGPQKRLSQALEARGFRRTRFSNDARGFCGIAVDSISVDKP